MNPSFVLDSSVTMTWCFEAEATAATAEILRRAGDETALVPALWYLEVVNTLALAEKRGRITPARTAGLLAHFETLDMEVDHEATERAFRQILPLCRTHRLTSYDAVYLELAARRHLPLATLDDKLRAAAQTLNVPLLGE